MCFNMKSYYFSIYSGYNMLSGRGTANAKNSFECSLRYLKYICSVTLTCLIYSFNNIYFECNRQSGSYECSYYVMQWMLTIVWAGTNRGWDQVIPQYKNTLNLGFIIHY